VAVIELPLAVARKTHPPAATATISATDHAPQERGLHGVPDLRSGRLVAGRGDRDVVVAGDRVADGLPMLTVTGMPGSEGDGVLFERDVPAGRALAVSLTFVIAAVPEFVTVTARGWRRPCP
jgi:hypothetical protein